MARVADHAGYMSNYFRWFGSPEDPFGWYYNLLALMTHVSDGSLWMRLPDLVAGLVCWLLLSREVLPRLGPAVTSSTAANWAAGMVLLTAWMPFNNGLRPEPIIALGSLITYVLIERSMCASRLTPAALAVVTAAFTLGVQPTGLIAVAALVAGGRPILRILVRRHRLVGTWPLVAPMLAAGSVILTVVFADQTLSTVLEATRIRTAIGPSQAWYTENLRYYYLILPTVDGSLSRRFGFLITALCLFTAVFIMLRRKRIPGVARGPAWRLMGVIFGDHVLPDVHPDQVGAPLRAVRRGGRGDGRADHGAGVAEGAALVAQPDGVRGGGVVRVGAVLRHHQRLVVRLQLRRAVQQRHAEARRNHASAQSFSSCSRSRRSGRSGCTSRRGPRRGPAGAGGDGSAGAARGRIHGAGVHRVDGRRNRAPVPHLLQWLGQLARIRRGLRDWPTTCSSSRTATPASWRPQNRARRLRPVGSAGRCQPNRVHPQRRTGTHRGRGGPGDVGAAARHRLRLVRVRLARRPS